jgi:hypothetical protein
MNRLDVLELELRRMPNVSFVGLRERPDALVVQVLALGHPDPNGLRLQVERACRAHLDRHFVVEIAGPVRPSRIRLLDVHVRAAEDGDEPEVEVHLGFEGVRTIGRGKAGDPSAAALATFEALTRLGASVPFRVEAAALFEHVLGEGVMLVLGSEVEGERYGVAAGANIEQAAVRATLHALNRFLSTQTLSAQPA